MSARVPTVQLAVRLPWPREVVVTAAAGSAVIFTDDVLSEGGRRLRGMTGPFIGSEALAAGMRWGELQRSHTRVYRGIYVPAGTDVTAAVRARAAWLWSQRRGVIAGLAASAMHGSNWVDRASSVDLYHDNRHRLPGLTIRSERIAPAEVLSIDGIPLTSPAQTAVDIGCWYPLYNAVASIDALARVTKLDLAEVQRLADAQRGRRGIVRARRVLGLADAGSQSPKESWLRMVLIEAGLPRPQTQIPVLDDVGRPSAYLDMGWEDVKVAAEYDGDQHRTDRRQYAWDVRRLERLQRRGWVVIRVTAEDSAADVVRRVRAAVASRVKTPSLARAAVKIASLPAGLGQAGLGQTGLGQTGLGQTG